jgi:sec-independent protein translocase protein TatB
MFDLAWTEMAVVAAIAILIIGPKEMPRVLRTVGQWVRRLRRMAAEFQDSVDEMVRDSDLEDLRNQVAEASPDRLRQEFTDAIDPSGSGDDGGAVNPADWSTKPGISTASPDDPRGPAPDETPPDPDRPPKAAG